MSPLPDTLVQFRTDLEKAIHRAQALRARQRRRQRYAVAFAAALVVVVGTASAFGTVREFFAKPSARGKLTRTVDGVRFSLTVPRTGWENGPHEAIGGKIRTRGLFISKSTVRGQAAEEVIYWAGVRGNGDLTPCAGALPSAAELSRADLAAALAKTPGTKPGGRPRFTTVGGRPAVSIVLRVKQELGCQPGFLFTWPHGECWGACWLRTQVGDSMGVTIVDVRGTRLLFVVITRPGAGDSQEIGDIGRSLRFH